MTGVLKGILMPFQVWNDVVLKIGRGFAIVAIALMVLAILIQVFYRYVLNNALPWPDEAARFMMLWMTGLIAPTGFRRGGFVAIDMVVVALPEKLGALLSFLLLVVSGFVLVLAVQIGYGEVTGFGGKFDTASLWLPFNFGGAGPMGFEWGWDKVPRSWMMASLLVGVVLLLIVNIELLIRSLIQLLGGGDEIRPVPDNVEEIMAE